MTKNPKKKVVPLESSDPIFSPGKAPMVIPDEYDWDYCYSYAWQVRQYWDMDSEGCSVSVFKAFPDIDWDDEEEMTGAMHQCIAICQGLTDRPEDRFFFEEVLVDRLAPRARRK